MHEKSEDVSVNKNLQLQSALKECEELFRDGVFVEDYIAHKTQEAQKKIEEVRKRIEIEVQQKINRVLDQMACKKIGVDSLVEGRSRGVIWGDTLRNAEKEIQQNGVDGENYTEWREKISLFVRQGLAEVLSEALETHTIARVQCKQTLQSIGWSFLQAQQDPLFQKCMLAWGDAPSRACSTKHAGLVHFVIYRSKREKDRLHKLPYEFSPEGFMAYTERLVHMLENLNDPGIKDAILFEGECGGKRLLLRNVEHDYVSFFQHPHESSFRIITHWTGCSDNNFQKSIRKMSDTIEQSQYFNSLRGEIHVKRIK